MLQHQQARVRNVCDGVVAAGTCRRKAASLSERRMRATHDHRAHQLADDTQHIASDSYYTSI